MSSRNGFPTQRRASPKAGANRRNSGKQSGLQLDVRSAPAARNFRVVPRQPTTRSMGKNTIIEGHEEIATVFGSTAYAATRYRVNPGLPIFTRLSEIAKTFEKWRARKLQFVYVPVESVTTTPGAVYLCADYDPVDPAPASLAALSTYETQDSSRVYDALKLSVSPGRMFDGVQHKKVRCGPVGGDLQLYDGASVSIATLGCTNADPIGQLWIYYEIELISPQTGPSTPLPQALTVYNLGSDQSLTSGSPEAVAWDEAIVDGLELTPVAGVFTMPCGAFLIQGEVGVSATSAGTLQITLFGKKNSASGSPWQYVESTSAITANGVHTVSFTFYVSSDGTDTFQTEITVGGGGTLVVEHDQARIAIQAL